MFSRSAKNWFIAKSLRIKKLKTSVMYFKRFRTVIGDEKMILNIGVDKYRRRLLFELWENYYFLSCKYFLVLFRITRLADDFFKRTSGIS